MLLYRAFRLRPISAAALALLGLHAQAAADTPPQYDHAQACHAPATAIAVPQREQGEGQTAPDATRISADTLSGESQVAVQAQGNVIVERNDQILNTAQIDYTQAGGLVRAPHTFTLQQGNSRVSGENLQYSIDNRSGSADNVQFETQTAQRRLQGSGERIEMENGQQYRVQNVRFNTCQPNDNSWYIQAKQIEADHSRNIGVAHDATFVIGGVPLLYTPWVDFPLDGGRKSGLLVPTLKTGSNGTELAAPYYFNLAPNYDLTLTPTLFTKRGLQVASHFRYLQTTYHGDAYFSILPRDRERNRSNRAEFKWTHQHRIRDNLHAHIDYHQVADDDHYRDFYNRDDIAANTNLNRQLRLSHHSNLLGGELNSQINVQKYQTLANVSGYRDAPYALLPQLSSNWYRQFNPNLHANIYTELTHFAHNSKPEGTRFVFHPSVRAEFNRPWGYIRPELQLHASHYRIRPSGGLTAYNQSRVLPLISIDAGLNLSRPIQFWGKAHQQTLEPRLFYTYAPARNQDRIPLFDTAENSFTFYQLFRPNRFSGHDRINAANFLTTALQTRLIDNEDGSEILRAGIGMRLYFSRSDIGLNGQNTRRQSGQSDILAFAEGRIARHTWLDSDLHYNTELETAERYQVGLRYTPTAGKTLSLRYRYRRDAEIYDGVRGQMKQAEVAVQWPLRPNIYLIGRHSYSFSIHKPLEHMLGIEYTNPCGCWSASVAGHHYRTGPHTHKNAVFVQLHLRNLSSLGNNPFQQLRQSIPGYTPIEELNRP